MSPLNIKKSIEVVILYVGGKSLDVQEIFVTMTNIKNALLKRGHKVKVIKVNKKNWRQAIKTTGEVFFNLVEDESWELYKKVAWGLEELGRAQVGTDKYMLEYGVDKKILKKKLIRSGVPTPKYRIFSQGEKYLHHIRKMDYPLIVKPAGQHAGIGISQDSVVIDEKEADSRINYLYNNYCGDVLVEEFIDGREVTVTVIGNGKRLVVLPIAELIFGGEYNNNWPIYSYNAKWVESTWEYWNVKVVCPAELSENLEAKIENIAKKTFNCLKIKDVVRMDMRLDESSNELFVVDVNASPGLDDNSDEGTTRAAKALGWSYEDMIETIVAVTYKRVYGKLPGEIKTKQSVFSSMV